MSDYKLLGLNLWTYSGRRAIGWLGGKESHYSDKKHYAMFEIGSLGCFGLEVTVGGEDREIQFRIGLGFTTLYVSLTGLVPDKYDKAKEIASQEKCYAHELDFSGQGRTTGIMLNFKHAATLCFSFWQDRLGGSARSVREKLKRFPYCEGIGKIYFIV